VVSVIFVGCQCVCTATYDFPGPRYLPKAERQAARQRAALARGAGSNVHQVHPLCKPACTPCPRPRSPGGCDCFLLPHTSPWCWHGELLARAPWRSRAWFRLAVSHRARTHACRAAAGHAVAVLACDSHDRHKFWCCKFTCCKSSDGSAESPRSR